MGADPRFHLLIARDFGESVGLGTEHGDEQRHLTDGGRAAVIDENHGPGPIDEGFLAGDVMFLLISPALVDHTVTAVAVTAGVSGVE